MWNLKSKHAKRNILWMIIKRTVLATAGHDVWCKTNPISQHLPFKINLKELYWKISGMFSSSVFTTTKIFTRKFNLKQLLGYSNVFMHNESTHHHLDFNKLKYIAFKVIRYFFTFFDPYRIKKVFLESNFKNEDCDKLTSF